MIRESTILTNWQFAMGASEPNWDNIRTVTVPHTWNVEEGTEDTWGTGWYRCVLPAQSIENKRIFAYFRAVYHDAVVFLNGKEISRHSASGFTPFSVELTDGWNTTGENILVVRVNNSFSPDLLPYQRSFDWANDGGIIRPVELWVTGSHYIEQHAVYAKPLIPVLGQRWDNGTAAFSVTGVINGIEGENLILSWEMAKGTDEHVEQPFAKGDLTCNEKNFCLPAQIWQNIDFWHFDVPNLYTFTLTLKKDGKQLDQVKTAVGFREIRTRGRNLYLNGENVRLCGTEWMPGSDPAFGMAEPKEQLEKMLKILKESNCVYTRFHWQQDDWVYDWCDRHGMLIQEEVPFWGRGPSVAGPVQKAVFEQQIVEMVTAHRNHPSIFAWGVGNELDAQAKETIQYIKDAVAVTHQLDTERFANYVTCTIYADPSKDGTTDGDILMINDYMGTWHPISDPKSVWDHIVRENPDRAMTPAEFGLCEPAFEGGDSRRESILREKIALYRNYENIVGTIYFCLNDYRTQIGEKGEGKMRRRVHGSTDLCGNPKPSYNAVKEECAPLHMTKAENGVLFICANDLPRYMVKGYYIVWKDKKIDIPDLKPGETWLCEELKDMDLNVYRASGDKMW